MTAFKNLNFNYVSKFYANENSLDRNFFTLG